MRPLTNRVSVAKSQNIAVNRPHVSLKIRSLMKRLVTVAAHVLRHLAAFLPQVTVQGALVGVRSAALGAGIRLPEYVREYVPPLRPVGAN